MNTALIAYHGCDVTTRDDFVSGRLQTLSHSNNRYDWLGSGAYFFEGDPDRAHMFAQASSDHPKKRYSAQAIASPAVVGAVLQVRHWLDLNTQAGIREYDSAYRSLVEIFNKSAKSLPQNRAAGDSDTDMIYRALDNAVFNWLHKMRDAQLSLPPFQAVRAAFARVAKSHRHPGCTPKRMFRSPCATTAV
ncbi:hypothetical protein ACLB1G_08570 [Oxalobacteraceae bacterium A2-2]